jgi:hypothetical protein
LNVESRIVALIAALTFVVAFAPAANAAFVDEYTTSQYIGSSGEDSTYTTGCYGKCGRGCSWYSCGYTSNCQTHDYYTRSHGLFSSKAMDTFAPAIRDWGACVYNGTKIAYKKVVSKVTNAAKWLWTVVRK